MTLLNSIPSEHRAQPGEAGNNREEQQSQLTLKSTRKFPMERNPGLAVPWMMGCSLWGRTESDMTEVTQQQQQHTILYIQVAPVLKNPPANAGDIMRRGFDPWVGKIPWRRA